MHPISSSRTTWRSPSTNQCQYVENEMVVATNTIRLPRREGCESSVHVNAGEQSPVLRPGTYRCPPSASDHAPTAEDEPTHVARAARTRHSALPSGVSRRT